MYSVPWVRALNLRLITSLLAMLAFGINCAQASTYAEDLSEMLKNGNKEKARALILDRVEKNSRDFDIQYLYIKMLISSGETSLAIQRARRNIRYGDNSPYSYILIIKSYISASGILSAKQDIENALSMFPDNEEIQKYDAKLSIVISLKKLSKINKKFASLMVSQIDVFFEDNMGLNDLPDISRIASFLKEYNSSQLASKFNPLFFSPLLTAVYPSIVAGEKESYPYKISNSKLFKHGDIYYFVFNKGDSPIKTYFEIKSSPLKIIDIKSIAIDN